MATITITYVKPVYATLSPVAQICATFVPTNAAADSETASIKGSYYDTNVEGFGDGLSADAFWNEQVAHPGLVAALRAAMRTGSYDWEATDADVQYVAEIAPALKEQGFTFNTGVFIYRFNSRNAISTACSICNCSVLSTAGIPSMKLTCCTISCIVIN